MIEVVLTPEQLPVERLGDSQVVVLDILRASSTIVTALAAGAKEVRLFADAAAAQAGAVQCAAPLVLGGERNCLRIEGFDLGNSPGEYETHRVGGATVCFTTTNGTRAALAAEGARTLLVGSLLNASATAAALLAAMQDGDTFLLCAGTGGAAACEDIIGAGAILWALLDQTHSLALPFTDLAWVAYHTFSAVRARLPAALRLGQGGINLIEAGLEDDIDLCAKLNTVPSAIQILREPLRAIPLPD